MIEIQRVLFDSEGAKCAGTFYLPMNATNKLSCVVLANGFSGTMDWILPDLAERFSKAGFAAFIFDYRHLGKSEGEPRQIINLKKQRTDLRNALRWVRNHTDIDKSKIALWGTSLGGSHVVEVAATDNEIAALIGNMPGIDAAKGSNIKAKAKEAGASNWQLVVASVRLLTAGIYDVVRSWFGLTPYYIPIYSSKGKAIFTDPSQVQRFETLAKVSATWENKIAARVLFNLPEYKEGTVEQIHAPILITLASKDIELDNEFVKRVFSKAANAEVKEYPYNHFTMYHGQAFEEVGGDQIAFLKKTLLP